jgi:hypothetical protein
MQHCAATAKTDNQLVDKLSHERKTDRQAHSFATFTIKKKKRIFNLLTCQEEVACHSVDTKSARKTWWA